MGWGLFWVKLKEGFDENASKIITIQKILVRKICLNGIGGTKNK